MTRPTNRISDLTRRRNTRRRSRQFPERSGPLFPPIKPLRGTDPNRTTHWEPPGSTPETGFFHRAAGRPILARLRRAAAACKAAR